jgi:hypothetical protein
MRTQANFIKNINDGLKTKLDVSNLKFKSTFAKAKKLGVDLENTTKFFKKDGCIYLVSITAFKYECDGKYRETVTFHPFLQLKK